MEKDREPPTGKEEQLYFSHRTTWKDCRYLNGWLCGVTVCQAEAAGTHTEDAL